MLGPNEFDALKAALPAQNATNANNTEALNRRRRQTGVETPLVQAADTVQLSRNAVQAAEQANRHTAPVPQVSGVPQAVPPTIAPPPQRPAQPAGAPAPQPQETAQLVRSLAASAHDVVQNEPEVRPEAVSQAARRLASLGGQDSAEVNARISEKFLTGL